MNRFDAGAVGLQFDRLPPRPVDHFGAILDLFALSSVLPPFDVVVALGVNFDFAPNADLIAEFTVRLYDGREKVPGRADFDFFEDIDAMFVAVAVAAFGHSVGPFPPPSGLRWCKADTMIDTTDSKCKIIKELAERVGFEPTVEFPRHTLSKRAP